MLQYIINVNNCYEDHVRPVSDEHFLSFFMTFCIFNQNVPFGNMVILTLWTDKELISDLSNSVRR